MDMESLEYMKKLDDLIKTSDAQPSRKQVLDMIDSADFADDVKESLRSMVKGNVPQLFGSYGSGTLLGMVFVLLIFTILLFFGYKLYKSLKEKEKKKEDKKKAKQLKKKK